jgi:hypothetical protein
MPMAEGLESKTFRHGLQGMRAGTGIPSNRLIRLYDSEIDEIARFSTFIFRGNWQMAYRLSY